MARNLFTSDEIILCAYAALHDENHIGGIKRIAMLTGRSEASIKMKIQNFVAMLDNKGIQRFSSWTPLSGVPNGAPARETNWEEIRPLIALTAEEFKRKCFDILAKY